ncbi:MAG TPA: hypothetical protein VGS61_03380 [Acidimicrobiales bacterium]|nr:hypothetical protein [Acidimicrobiales bacterium]
MSTTRRILSRGRAAAGVIAVSLALVAPMAVVAPSASATQVSFCNTIRHEHPVKPAGRQYSTWHPFVTIFIGFFQQLDSEAPPLMGRAALNGLVAVLKNFTTAANSAQIAADIEAHPRWWSLGWSRYYSDIEYCATHPSV